MILLGIFIGASVGFFKFAKENNLIAWAWAIAPIASYLITALIVGLFIGFYYPELLEEKLILGAIELVVGCVGIGIAYLFMQKAAKNKKIDSPSSSDILDLDID